MKNSITKELLNNSSIDDLNEINTVCSFFCEAPISLISLIDDGKFTFKSKVGLNDMQSITINNSFCQYVIKQEKLIEINNLLTDKRFINNPYVVGEPYIRFYAGIPLIMANGYCIGTLSIMDTIPRKLNEKQKILMITLSKRIIDHIELNRINNDFNLLNKKFFELKEEFINNITYELKSQTYTINGFIDLLKKTNLDLNQKNCLNMINYSSDMLLVLKDNILDYSDIGSDGITLNKKPFNLCDLVMGMRNIFNSYINENDIDLKINIEKNIPRYIIGDRVRINQILINLIRNSLKFIENGSVYIDCTTNNIIDNSIDILFKIKGKNMLNKECKNISMKTLYHESCSLGFEVSKKLIELHNSQLFINSNSGVDTEQYFSAKFEISKELPEFNSNQLKILVIDDTEYNYYDIKNYLSDKCDIEIEFDCVNGLNKLLAKEYDILILDLDIPFIKDNCIINHVRKNLKINTPMIAVSGKNNEYENNKFFENGIDDYLIKPLKKKDLFNSILKIKGNYLDSNKIFNFNLYHEHKYIFLYEKINMETFKEYTGDDIELQNEIIFICIKDFDACIINLNKYISNNNYDKIKDLAYKMKSNVILFGLYSLNKIFTELEGLSVSKDMTRIIDIYYSIKFCLRRNIKELEKIQGLRLI